jgi:peptidylprolyl isomerase
VAQDSADTLIMTLESGPVTIKLRPDLAPNHVAQISALADEGFYDGVVFHRVIPGFMAQGGDPSGTGGGGSKRPNLKAEFSAASARWRAPTIRIRPTANFSSASTTPASWTGNIRSGAR